MKLLSWIPDFEQEFQESSPCIGESPSPFHRFSPLPPPPPLASVLAYQWPPSPPFSIEGRIGDDTIGVSYSIGRPPRPLISGIHDIILHCCNTDLLDRLDVH